MYFSIIDRFFNPCNASWKSNILKSFFQYFNFVFPWSNKALGHKVLNKFFYQRFPKEYCGFYEVIVFVKSLGIFCLVISALLCGFWFLPNYRQESGFHRLGTNWCCVCASYQSLDCSKTSICSFYFNLCSLNATPLKVANAALFSCFAFLVVDPSL